MALFKGWLRGNDEPGLLVACRLGLPFSWSHGDSARRGSVKICKWMGFFN